MTIHLFPTWKRCRTRVKFSNLDFISRFSRCFAKTKRIVESRQAATELVNPYKLILYSGFQCVWPKQKRKELLNLDRRPPNLVIHTNHCAGEKATKFEPLTPIYIWHAINQFWFICSDATSEAFHHVLMFRCGAASEICTNPINKSLSICFGWNPSFHRFQQQISWKWILQTFRNLFLIKRFQEVQECMVRSYLE